MTISLAIDTSTSKTIVGVIEDGVVLFEKAHEGATDHGRALSELVAQALKVAKPPHQVVV
jgi:tRNA A37 threonylcarbamoyladenosine modification protein TsaB